MSPIAHRPPIVTGIIFGLIGLGLLGGGAWLVALGGSAYYVIAGAACLLTGGLLIAGRRLALDVFAALLIGTLIWAVAEIGFDWWPLAARGDVLFPLALWLLFPFVNRGLLPAGPSYIWKTWPLWVAVVAAVFVLGIGLSTTYHEVDGHIDAAAAAPPPAPSDADWPAYGRTNEGQRYSPLTQITPANVARLKVAWTFHTGDIPGKGDPVESTFEVTPIKIADTLYLCSPHQILFALDARTGVKKWSYDPQIHDDPTFQHLTCRGVSYHETLPGALDADGAPAPTDCPRMVFLPVNDGRMIGLNAETGDPCDSFADHGTLDLEAGMKAREHGFYEPTSPPVASDTILVVGGSVTDNYSRREPSGVVRGFDIHTGKLVWAWDSGAADENEMPSATHDFTGNSPNSWITASYDAKLGLVYLPMGVRTPDIWGGLRPPLAERYSSALVALDIKTGKRVWSYQTVHHDLWDMDLPSQPSLVDWPTPTGPVPAIIQPAKSGNLFVLDRRDGHLLVPAPERPVPQGAAPGDHVAATQPFSELSFRPEALLTGEDMWGATMFDELACRVMFKRLNYHGTFTPPSLRGTLVFPGNLGMFEWGGVAVDPVRDIAIANPIEIPFVSTLIPRGPDNPSEPDAAHPPRSEIGVQPMYGTPYGVTLHALLSPLGLPCKRPPWGFMAGIDLKTHKIAWMHRNGTIRDEAPLPIPIRMGVPSLGGPMTTAGGVAFLTSTMDYYIRAYDVTDGRILWTARLPAGGQSTPMSYAVDGRQYVVTADGGHGSFGTKVGDSVIAYALPED